MKNKVSIHLALAFSFIFIFSGIAQNSVTKNSSDKVNVKLSCVAFYNLENLFDTINNENVNDEEYTPEGPIKWNPQKYNAKIQHMSYAISQIGLDYSPVGVAFIGVSEIENLSL